MSPEPIRAETQATISGHLERNPAGFNRIAKWRVGAPRLASNEGSSFDLAKKRDPSK